MRQGLMCESGGATFVKRDSQLRQPGLGDNSLPVRVCVHYMQVHVCVCACAGARSSQEWISGSYSYLFALYLHCLDINFRAVLQHRAQVVSVIHLDFIQNGHEEDGKRRPKWEAYIWFQHHGIIGGFSSIIFSITCIIWCTTKGVKQSIKTEDTKCEINGTIWWFISKWRENWPHDIRLKHVSDQHFNYVKSCVAFKAVGRLS